MIENNLSVVIGKKKLTISEVSKIAGIKYDTVKSLYYGRTKGIEFETLNRLCFALECTPGDIFKYVED